MLFRTNSQIRSAADCKFVPGANGPIGRIEHRARARRHGAVVVLALVISWLAGQAIQAEDFVIKLGTEGQTHPLMNWTPPTATPKTQSNFRYTGNAAGMAISFSPIKSGLQADAAGFTFGLPAAGDWKLSLGFDFDVPSDETGGHSNLMCRFNDAAESVLAIQLEPLNTKNAETLRVAIALTDREGQLGTEEHRLALHAGELTVQRIDKTLTVIAQGAKENHEFRPLTITKKDLKSVNVWCTSSPKSQRVVHKLKSFSFRADSSPTTMASAHSSGWQRIAWGAGLIVLAATVVLWRWKNKPA